MTTLERSTRAVRGTYASPYERLVANTHEPENAQACWIWAAKRDRWGYGQINLYVPGLGRVVTLKAHVATYVWGEAACSNANDLYLAYLEHVCSGLELDHLCDTPMCTCPDHLDPKTPSENCAMRGRRH